MKSSTGKYFLGLDHIRAFAAFIVFAWHFIHVNHGNLASPPIFPLSLFTEGHTGVALFMTLSGYLFAKLLEGKQIKYICFLWNRILRLIPLLILVICLDLFQQYSNGANIKNYIKLIEWGIIKPTLPNGGWSITAEFHFYLLLPILLFFTSKNKKLPIIIVIIAITTRLILYYLLGQIQSLSYWTIIGRIDNFTIGIFFYYSKEIFYKNHCIVAAMGLSFLIIYWYFDYNGGFYKQPSYPSPSPIWIIMPTLEGVFYGTIIAWYDSSFAFSNHSFIQKICALVGECSYSIYLLHFFVVFKMADYINLHIVKLSNNHLSLLFVPICFAILFPFAYISYKYFETPFLKFRVNYIRNNSSANNSAYG